MVRLMEKSPCFLMKIEPSPSRAVWLLSGPVIGYALFMSCWLSCSKWPSQCPSSPRAPVPQRCLSTCRRQGALDNVLQVGVRLRVPVTSVWPFPFILQEKSNPQYTYTKFEACRTMSIYQLDLHFIFFCIFADTKAALRACWRWGKTQSG